MKKYLKVLYIALIVLFLYLPIGTLMVLSFNESKSMTSWQGFSFRWYREMFSNEELMEALGNTFTIALWASMIATVIGVMACIAMNAMTDRKRNIFMGLNNIPLLNADIVTGISLMISFLLFGISLNYGTVLFAHVTFCIPYVILSVMPKFKQLENHTYEAALDLGASPAYAFFKVVLPDLMPGITSGFLLSFTMSVDDFVITHFTRGAGINTLSTLIYSQLKIGVRPTLFALSTVIFLVVLVILLISNYVRSEDDETKPKKAGKKETTEKDYIYRSGMTLGKKILVGILAVVIIAAAVKFTPSTPGEVGENGVVYVYNFGDYIDPELTEQFFEETGYTVVCDYFDTNEEMYPVIKNNTADYDVICASDYMIDKLIKEDLLMEIEFGQIPNIQYLSQNIRDFMEEFDPGMFYSAPHTWGTYGIIYNTELVDEEDFEGDVSWDILWDEKYAGKIIMPNSIREADMVAAKLLGYSMNTLDEEEMKEITDKLIEQKPLVYSYANDNARDLMIGDNASMAVITSGDVLYAQEDNENLAYVIPVEGTEVWTDCWAVPKSCKNFDGAMAWINFMYSYDAAVANFEYLTYAIPNTQLDDYVYEDYIEGEMPLSEIGIVNPSEDVLARCETLKNLGPDGDDMYSRYWKLFKSK
ncbi:MAG: extracellular solute-binding protein [Anaerovoracaceae bacterium]|nr:extracellular solute-binding protein [Anaerovoracaceae bacterium]